MAKLHKRDTSNMPIKVIPKTSLDVLNSFFLYCSHQPTSKLLADFEIKKRQTTFRVKFVIVDFCRHGFMENMFTIFGLFMSKICGYDKVCPLLEESITL